MEARGFIFGAPVALALGVGFVPVRKPGKLPRATVSTSYDLEYGSETLAVHADAITAGARVLIVDDVLATGGTIAATADLVHRLGAELIGVRSSWNSDSSLAVSFSPAGESRTSRHCALRRPELTIRDPFSTRSARYADRSSKALVSLPARTRSPGTELALRGLAAVVLLAIVVALVYFDRGSYTDNYDGQVSLIDAIYYATVTITTTGYGDITPVRPHARILNAIVVTPLRIAFLVLLVGTTLEVLANEGRRMFQDTRWRKRMRNHVVVVGYGTKGRSAVDTC